MIQVIIVLFWMRSEKERKGKERKGKERKGGVIISFIQKKEASPRKTNQLLV